MPKRVNKAVELLSQDQPIYYTGSHTGANLTYEAGKAMSKTWADYINVGFEHGLFDLIGLDNFMRGLSDGGPTNSGHQTPAFVIEIPENGTSAAAIQANDWQFRQLLARGVHGLLLCHAENPEAVKTFVEYCRYPFQKIGVDDGLDVGRRGSAGQSTAALIWGVSVEEYLDKADPWPLNPDGELMLGLKIENVRALANVEQSLKVPGIAFAEWGPGDMGMSFGYPDWHDPPYPPEMIEARATVLKACKDHGVAFLNAIDSENVTEMIDEGVMVGCGSRDAVEIGKRYTERDLP